MADEDEEEEEEGEEDEVDAGLELAAALPKKPAAADLASLGTMVPLEVDTAAAAAAAADKTAVELLAAAAFTLGAVAEADAAPLLLPKNEVDSDEGLALEAAGFEATPEMVDLVEEELEEEDDDALLEAALGTTSRCSASTSFSSAATAGGIASTAAAARTEYTCVDAACASSCSEATRRNARPAHTRCRELTLAPWRLTHSASNRLDASAGIASSSASHLYETTSS